MFTFLKNINFIIFTQSEKKNQINYKVDSSQISNLFYVDIAFKPNSEFVYLVNCKKKE